MTRLAERVKRSPLPRLAWWAHSGIRRLLKPIGLGVRTMVLDNGGRVLLVRHSYRPGWHFPGGGVRRWETLSAAAIRETVEESGVAILTLEPLVGMYANFSIGYPDHVALFIARDWQPGTARSMEIVETGFFAMDALPADTSLPTRRRVDEFRGNRTSDGYW